MLPSQVQMSAPKCLATSMDDFDVGVTLGTGSFGRVRLATKKDDGSSWAVKMLKKAEGIRLQQVEHEPLGGVRQREARARVSIHGGPPSAPPHGLGKTSRGRGGGRQAEVAAWAAARGPSRLQTTRARTRTCELFAASGLAPSLVGACSRRACG